MPIRIVVVDDHADTRQLYASAFEFEADLEVVGEAETGEAALLTVRDLDPNVVLVDQRMTGMTGVETIGRLRTLVPEASIVLLTAGEIDMLRRDALEAGADAVIQKNGRLADLVALIRGLVARPG